MIKAVIDNNVLISGLLKDGTPRKIINAVIDRRIIPVLSDEIFSELVSVLARKELNSLIPAFDITALMTLLKEKAIWVKPSVKINACRDIEDNKVLEAAEGVPFIITGDKDLVALHPFRGSTVLTPSVFVREYLK